MQPFTRRERRSESSDHQEYHCERYCDDGGAGRDRHYCAAFEDPHDGAGDPREDPQHEAEEQADESARRASSRC